MIPIKKEPTELYRLTKVYEKCIFCNSETDTWSLDATKPICVDCAKVKDIEDLKPHSHDTAK